MKLFPGIFRSFLLASVSGLLLGVPTAYAQESVQIEGTVLLPNGLTASFSNSSADPLWIKSTGGALYSFSFEASPDPQTLTVSFFSVDAEGNLLAIESVEVMRRESVNFQAESELFRLEITSFRREAEAAKPPSPSTVISFSGSCCVSCDGITVCGGSVSMTCGSCDGGGPKAI